MAKRKEQKTNKNINTHYNGQKKRTENKQEY